jgi:hypothetical protein
MRLGIWGSISNVIGLIFTIEEDFKIIIILNLGPDIFSYKRVFQKHCDFFIISIINDNSILNFVYESISPVKFILRSKFIGLLILKDLLLIKWLVLTVAHIFVS